MRRNFKILEHGDHGDREICLNLRRILKIIIIFNVLFG